MQVLLGAGAIAHQNEIVNFTIGASEQFATLSVPTIAAAIEVIAALGHPAQTQFFGKYDEPAEGAAKPETAKTAAEREEDALERDRAATIREARAKKQRIRRAIAVDIASRSAAVAFASDTSASAREVREAIQNDAEQDLLANLRAAARRLARRSCSASFWMASRTSRALAEVSLAKATAALREAMSTAIARRMRCFFARASRMVAARSRSRASSSRSAAVLAVSGLAAPSAGSSYLPKNCVWAGCPRAAMTSMAAAMVGTLRVANCSEAPMVKLTISFWWAIAPAPRRTCTTASLVSGPASFVP